MQVDMAQVFVDPVRLAPEAAPELAGIAPAAPGEPLEISQRYLTGMILNVAAYRTLLMNARNGHLIFGR
jgi:hypothetical protein